jgi:hypothetical protein
LRVGLPGFFPGQGDLPRLVVGREYIQVHLASFAVQNIAGLVEYKFKDRLLSAHTSGEGGSYE